MMTKEDRLYHLCQWYIQRQKDDEERLKRFGLNWNNLKLLEQEVIDQIPEQGLKINGYHILKSERNIIVGKPTIVIGKTK